MLRLFGGLTVLWAGVHIVTAAITFGMLVSMPVATFVAFKTLTCLAVTIGAIVITILWALRVVRSERRCSCSPGAERQLLTGPARVAASSASM